MGNNYCCTPIKKRKAPHISSLKIVNQTQNDANFVKYRNIQNQFSSDFQKCLTILRQNRTFCCDKHRQFNIQILQKIGKGGQSQVYKIHEGFQGNEKQLALKIIPKANITKVSIKKSIAMQNLILEYNDSPFLMKNLFTRQDQSNIYFFSPLAAGGDLISFIEDYTSKGIQFRKNEEENIKFVLAGIILGLQYLHNLDIVFNDLKLQNILINKDGYPCITDFGLIAPQNSYYYQEPVGTVLYFPPEKVYGCLYQKQIDLWALGVLIYAFFYKELPFQKEIIQSQNFCQIAKKKQMKHKRLNIKGSKQIKNLINDLLVVQPKKRIGSDSYLQLKNHEFFHNFDWQSYQKKKMTSPLKCIIQKNPFKGDQNISISKVKIFRNELLNQQYLMEFSPDRQTKYTKESKLHLNKSLCKTKDRFSYQSCENQKNSSTSSVEKERKESS